MKTEDILFPNVYRTNKQRLEKLKNSLKEGEWMLCLGAGVSISVGLPNWYKLIAQLTARLLPIEVTQVHKDDENEDDTNRDVTKSYYQDIRDLYSTKSLDDIFFQKIQDSINGKYDQTFQGINVLEAAEYIRNFIKNMIGDLRVDDKKEKLDEQINSHMNRLIQEACKSDFVKDMGSDEVKNSTLGAVAKLMKSDKDSIVHNVITYNYDNLLEEYLRRNCNCPDAKVHSIVKRDDLRDFNITDEWNIYHVHGRVPVVECPGEEMSETVILTETDYYQEERINYSWTNIVQSYAIARANLIFIGFSGTDYNFRRIIKYVDQEQINRHDRYIFFLVDDIVAAVFRKETDKGTELSHCIEEMNNDTNNRFTFEKLFINYMIHAQTLYWDEHGLKVIWSSREELASDIDSIH